MCVKIISEYVYMNRLSSNVGFAEAAPFRTGIGCTSVSKMCTFESNTPEWTYFKPPFAKVDTFGRSRGSSYTTLSRAACTAHGAGHKVTLKGRRQR